MSELPYKGKVIVINLELEKGEREYHAFIRTADGTRFRGRESQFRGVHCLTYAMRAIDERIERETVCEES
jgi:hypothetical protein